MACQVVDIEAVEHSAALALELALEFHDADLEVRALADGGLALVSQGRTQEGFRRLDEALAAITAGEVRDRSAVGKSFCAMLSACDRTGDLRRTSEWTRLMTELLPDPRAGWAQIQHPHCRSAYGSVLCGMGRWPEGEQALTEVLDPTSSATVFHRMLTSCHLADLRMLQGRLEEAEELLRPWSDNMDACCPRARLLLATGELDLAASVASTGLAMLGSDLLRSAPLWAVAVRIELARKDLPAARLAADELTAITSRTELPALHAEGWLASALVCEASGEYPNAVEQLHRARTALGSDGPQISMPVSATHWPKPWRATANLIWP